MTFLLSLADRFSAISPLHLLLVCMVLMQGCATYMPSDEYQKMQLHGFTLLIDPKLSDQQALHASTLKELDGQLARIAAVVPWQALSELRKVAIWVETDIRNHAARFHVDEKWLRSNGINPQKTGAVEISNARLFVAWSQADQPWMLMHELAHAYHARNFGYAYKPILDAYHDAKKNRRYESVAYIRGGKKPAYAMTNAQEYFAELTESYFGRNDYFPYTRADLRSFDPLGYQLMLDIWGEKQ